MLSFISDQYRQNRGGWSRALAVSCKACDRFLFHYQKDGPGPLKRSYLDRVWGESPTFNQKGYAFCPHCSACLGFDEPHAKENNRPAIRWAAEAVEYRIVPLEKCRS